MFRLYQASYDLLIAQIDLIFPVIDDQKMILNLGISFFGN